MKHRNARLGRWLCLFYVALYAAFVLVNAFRPTAMESTPALGVNWAIWSGFGLIVVAIVLSVLYGLLCRNAAPEDSAERGSGA